MHPQNFWTPPPSPPPVTSSAIFKLLCLAFVFLSLPQFPSRPYSPAILMIPGVGTTPKPAVSNLAARRYVCLSCRCRTPTRHYRNYSTAVGDGGHGFDSRSLAASGGGSTRPKSSVSILSAAHFPIDMRPLQNLRLGLRKMGEGSPRRHHASAFNSCSSGSSAHRTTQSRDPWAGGPFNPPSPLPHMALHRGRPNESQRRALTTGRTLAQHSAAESRSADPHSEPVIFASSATTIRAQLREWQAQHEKEQADDALVAPHETTQSVPDEPGDGNELTGLSVDNPEGTIVDTFLRQGDLVEWKGMTGVSQLAVYIRKTKKGNFNQIYDVKGQVYYVRESALPYSIPAFFAPEEIEPMLEHIPSLDLSDEELAKLESQSHLIDTSVPRELSAPIIQRLVRFQQQSEATYRQHAVSLDNAHELLAHETDLQYSSLRATASTLLKRAPQKLSDLELYAVRQALINAGFAFGFDRRSHRSTGHLQIRSKEFVSAIKSVRDWLHAWQEDLAARANPPLHNRHNAKTNDKAKIIYAFVEKARQLILKSRQDRQPTRYGLGPSKHSFPLEKGSQVVRDVVGPATFSRHEIMIIQFLEVWCLGSMFKEDIPLQSLAPVLLSATGLYEDLPGDASGGMMFLAELGVLAPYADRAAFDVSLLLPTSQHSEPLRRLAKRLTKLRTDSGFKDSMAHLRRDWGDLTVFCVDGAHALEIDDGFSIEDAGPGADGRATHWIHTHIANPTAFFARDHPVAQMCRHMGETVYMPDQTYSMLPPWAGKEHFSLKKDRCCLTFSTLLDADGIPLERKITPGIVRNVKSLTPHDLANFIAEDKSQNVKPYLLTVGGAIPPPQQGSDGFFRLTPADKAQLFELRHLASKLHARRTAAGGLSFDQARLECTVKRELDRPGLGWQFTRRAGGWRVLGDPAIQLQLRPLRNWFEPSADTGGEVVQEVMLLACETAAQWCHDRKIPALFRGTVPLPDQRTSPEAFYEEKLAPAAERHNGSYPLELGLDYLKTFGGTVMATSAIKHRILGMSAYAKVTSPLRRYGDMIMHWQIEAALRQEWSTGQSLITDKDDAVRSFLPFSAAALEAITVGLKAREKLISNTKSYSNTHWAVQLLFRSFNFGARCDAHVTATEPSPEDFVTLQRLPEVFNFYVSSVGHRTKPGGYFVQFDGLYAVFDMEYARESAQVGDIWQARIQHVETHSRVIKAVLLKRLYRVGEDGYAGWLGNGPPLDLPGTS